MISFTISILFFVLCAGKTLNRRDDNEGDLAMQNPDLFEGDILGTEDWQDRNAVPQSYRRWPGAVIPYKISPDLAPQEANIKAAMKHYEEKTCIKFVPRTNQMQYVNIFAGQGCYSHVGKTLGSQPLSLGRGCYSFGTIVHELGHAVGFFHEHSRSDRDDFLNIYWDNIQSVARFANIIRTVVVRHNPQPIPEYDTPLLKPLEARCSKVKNSLPLMQRRKKFHHTDMSDLGAGMEDQFEKLRPKQNVLFDTFDYNSIMLYGETVFSKNHFLGLKTMEAKDSDIILEDVNKKKGLSNSDIFRISRMYNCTDLVV